jgi:hypothetical protein
LPVAKDHVDSRAFGRKVRLGRSLNVNPDRVLVEQPPASGNDAAVLSALYGEVCSSWHQLIDVRFKLLGLVPAVSAVALATLLTRKPDEVLETWAGIGIAAFGFLVTLALFIYDQRNSQLHDELISRGRRIEYELGIQVGQFLGRPGSWRFVKHDYATSLVYVATLAVWVLAIVVLATRDGT